MGLGTAFWITFLVGALLVIIAGFAPFTADGVGARWHYRGGWLFLLLLVLILGWSQFGAPLHGGK